MPRLKRQLTFHESSQLLQDVHHFGVNIRDREIFLTSHHAGGDSPEESEIEHRSATTFIKNLSVLEKLGWSKITVNMHIDGGNWSDGMAIFNAIQLAKSHITIIAHGQASSMSGIVLQAADTRIMMPDCHFMLHYGSVGLEANSNAASEFVKTNDAWGKRMLNIFAEKCVNGEYFKSKKMSPQKVTEFLDKGMKEKVDWYMTAKQAKYLGFCDRIYGEKYG